MASLCCVVSDTFIICCPRKRVNYNLKGPLVCCNLPCEVERPGAESWYSPDPWTTDKIVTVIPSSESMLLPSVLLFLPCFWLHVCLLLCMSEQQMTAHMIEPSPDGQSLMLYRKSRWVCCDDGHEFDGNTFRGVVSGASLQHTKAESIFSSDTLELSITVSAPPPANLVNLSIEKISSSRSETKQSLECLVMTINQRVSESWAQRNGGIVAQVIVPAGAQFVPGQPLPNWQPPGSMGLAYGDGQAQAIPAVAVAVPVENEFAGYAAQQPNYSGASVFVEPSAPLQKS